MMSRRPNLDLGNGCHATAVHSRKRSAAGMGHGDRKRVVTGESVKPAFPPSCEIWKDIPGYAGAYQVSSHGRVRSLPRLVPVYDSVRQISYARPCPGKILRQSVCDKAGHVSVHLGKYCRGIPVHQLVILAFHGFPPPGLEAMHLNGNPKDNRPENLKYGTHSENMTDMYRLGKGHLKLTPEEVRQIRFGLHCGWSVKELACVYGVSVACIQKTGKGRRYAWVA